MGRKLFSFDAAHNPTQLAAELRAAGIDAFVTDKESNRFWINAADTVDQDTINQVVADHVPSAAGDFSGEFAGQFALSNGLSIVALDTAITPNVTLTSAPAGTPGITSHATGRGQWFFSDGTKWQN